MLPCEIYDCKTKPQVRHTKIIATARTGLERPGHASTALIAAGVDVFRLNFSHGTQAEHAAPFTMVRDAARARRPPRRDSAGPVRAEDPHRPAGRRQGHPAEPGKPLIIAIGDEVGRPGHVFTTLSAAGHEPSQPGDRLLLDDGQVELRVESATDRHDHARA